MLFVTQIPDYVQRLDKELVDLGRRYPMIRDMIPELDPSSAESHRLSASASAPWFSSFSLFRGAGRAAQA